MKPDICIYHGNCADGFTAAYAVWKRFGDAVEYVPGIYGEAPPDVSGKHVVIVDFSYKRSVLVEMAESAASVLVLDHHKTAQEGLSNFIEPDEKVTDPWGAHVSGLTLGIEEPHLSPKIPRALFDMSRSGAGIAWDFFHPNRHAPLLISYVEDRDLWRFKLPNSRAVNAFVFSHDYSFENWLKIEAIIEHRTQDAVEAGEAIERKHHKDIRELLKVTERRMVIGGVEVPVANLPYTMSSDAGNIMASIIEDQGLAGAGLKYPFAACYCDTPKGRVFSLRSSAILDDAADVSAIAKRYGGGGHKNAAGFTMPIGWEGDQ